MTVPYTVPAYGKTAFNCPHCGAYANQVWCDVYYGVSSGTNYLNRLKLVICTHCKEYSIWHDTKMTYPCVGAAPLPNSDLPNEIKSDYEEARTISLLSPRGAAAILRLAIQKLCKHLGEKGENINNDVANLVKKGLQPKIQKSLDIVRVVGNNAVHPGQIDLKDNPAIAEKLFSLVNIIADTMITQPKHIDELYDNTLPEDQKQAIDKRDGK